MTCIVCGKEGNLLGVKEEIGVSYCNEHAKDCVEAGASCVCAI